MDKINKIEVKIDGFGDEAGYYAHIPQMPGMGEQGDTEEEAFNQLMISLRVKIMYDNQLIF